MSSQELLAVGLFGPGSRLGDRIEMLLRQGRTFSGRVSMGRVAASVAALIACGIAVSFVPRPIVFAQEPAFEVASVKPANPANAGSPRGRGRGGPRTADPERFEVQGYSMFGLLLMAYDVRAYQISGPSWLQNEKYDIQAKVPAGATRPQLPLMVRTLLTERFGLKVHHETKDFDGYDLVVAKGGPKLKAPQPPSAAESAAAAAARARGQLPVDKDGCLTSGANVCLGGTRFVSRGQSLAGLVAYIDSMGKPVRDQTGLSGLYDFTLTFADPTDRLPVARADVPAEPLPDLFTALQEQLGLKLESKKLPLDVIVVDHVERVPSAN